MSKTLSIVERLKSFKNDYAKVLHWIPVNVHAALKKFPFSVTIALSFGRVWAIRVDANFFENGEKKNLRF